MNRVQLFVIVLLLGCGSNKEGHVHDAPPPALETGWQRHIAGEVTMALPQEWQMLNLSQGDVNALMEAAAAQNPQLGNVAQFIRNAPASISFKLFAFLPPAPGSQFANNINVVEEKLSGSMSLGALADANEKTIKNLMPSIAIKRTDVKLPIGDAIRLDYASPTGTGQTLQTTNYLILRDEVSYAITFTLEAGAQAPVEKIMETVRLN